MFLANSCANTSNECIIAMNSSPPAKFHQRTGHGHLWSCYRIYVAAWEDCRYITDESTRFCILRKSKRNFITKRIRKTQQIPLRSIFCCSSTNCRTKLSGSFLFITDLVCAEGTIHCISYFGHDLQLDEFPDDGSQFTLY